VDGFYGTVRLASRAEGLPIVILEAGARGKPVVATSVGDIPEVLSDGVTGRVVPANHPDAFAQAVVELLDDLESRMSPTAPQDTYHSTGKEQDREADLRRLIPNRYGSAIDAGARDGFYSLILADHFKSVIALDLSKPPVEHPRVTAVAGDLTRLPYPDGSFDAYSALRCLSTFLSLKMPAVRLSAFVVMKPLSVFLTVRTFESVAQRALPAEQRTRRGVMSTPWMNVG